MVSWYQHGKSSAADVLRKHTVEWSEEIKSTSTSESGKDPLSALRRLMAPASCVSCAPAMHSTQTRTPLGNWRASAGSQSRLACRGIPRSYDATLARTMNHSPSYATRNSLTTDQQMWLHAFHLIWQVRWNSLPRLLKKMQNYSVHKAVLWHCWLGDRKMR